MCKGSFVVHSDEDRSWRAIKRCLAKLVSLSCTKPALFLRCEPVESGNGAQCASADCAFATLRGKFFPVGARAMNVQSIKSKTMWPKLVTFKSTSGPASNDALRSYYPCAET
eukprot:834591-Pleurochrysis_carterae.AAC.1